MRVIQYMGPGTSGEMSTTTNVSFTFHKTNEPESFIFKDIKLINHQTQSEKVTAGFTSLLGFQVKILW